MATTKQIYQLVNDIREQHFGRESVEVLNTTGLVSFGDMVLSSNTNKEKFYNALVDRIGLTIIAVRDYVPAKRNVIKSAVDYDLIVQKISYHLSDATNDNGWNLPSDPVDDAFSQKSPFEITSHVEAVQKLFQARGVWSFEEMIPDFQLRTAFTSPEKMGAFIGGIYTTIQNSMALAIEDMGNLAVCTAIAKISEMSALENGNKNVMRNLLYEYNTSVLGMSLESGAEDYPVGWLKAERCLHDKDFLLYASMELNKCVKNMSTFSTIFNAEEFERFTPSENCVVEVLNEFGMSAQYYSESKTYHDNLVKLPDYEDVPFWQGSGNGFKFADTSKIMINDTTVNGVIAFIHDENTVMATMSDMRTNTLYNPRNEVVNYFAKANKGYAFDSSENGVVFYVEDVAIPQE